MYGSFSQQRVAPRVFCGLEPSVGWEKIQGACGLTCSLTGEGQESMLLAQGHSSFIQGLSSLVQVAC